MIQYYVNIIAVLCYNEPCNILTRLKSNKGALELILVLSIGDDIVECANFERKINVSVEYFILDKLIHIELQCFEMQTFSQSIPAINSIPTMCV